jgi:CO/xanthine dehydrogenase FAD-binding subunit
MNIREYFKPASIEEAYRLLQDKKGTIIGGGVFLHLGKRDIDAAIDLTELKLDFICEKNGYIRIGAYATLSEVENSELLKQNFSGILSKTAGIIMGVQIRNIATIGGCVCGKYGFSDLLTSLLALDAQVELYKHGSMSLEKYLESKTSGDILMAVVVKKEDIEAAYSNLRNTSTDFSILNTAVSKMGKSFRICVGARPSTAVLAHKAAEFMEGAELTEENAIKAGEIAAEELEFGCDLRGSSSYRKELCKALVMRCIMEVV